MPLFRPPTPAQMFDRHLALYERRFRVKTPQWLLVLSPDAVTRITTVCRSVGWKLPPKLLVVGEPPSGNDSLWAQRKLPLDHYRSPVSPRDLTNLQNSPAGPPVQFGPVKRRSRKK